MQTNVESWTCQRMRGGHGKQSRAFLLSRRKPSCFSSVSPDMLMWKWERTRYLFLLCYEDYWRSTSVKSFPRTMVWNQTKPRNGSCKQSCMWLYFAFSPPIAVSSNGSFKNIPATHSWQYKRQKNKFLDVMKDVVLVWFYYKHKHFMCDL